MKKRELLKGLTAAAILSSVATVSSIAKALENLDSATWQDGKLVLHSGDWTMRKLAKRFPNHVRYANKISLQSAWNIYAPIVIEEGATLTMINEYILFNNNKNGEIMIEGLFGGRVFAYGCVFDGQRRKMINK